MRNRFLAGMLLVAAAVVVGGCSAEGKLTSRSALTGGLWTVKLESAAFRNAEEIPEKYTQHGMNTSPPLKWSGGPSGTVEWILIVEDADATFKEGPEKGLPLTHWAVFKIPVNVKELPEGAAKSITYPQGKNYLGENTYAGPKPPPGKKHRYFFQIFAVDTAQDFTPGMTRQELGKAFKGNVLSKGQLVGTFTGPKE